LEAKVASCRERAARRADASPDGVAEAQKKTACLQPTLKDVTM